MDGFKTVFRESSISRDLCNEAVECNGVLEPLRSNLIESNAITASRSAVDERLHKELGNPTGPVQRAGNVSPIWNELAIIGMDPGAELVPTRSPVCLVGLDHKIGPLHPSFSLLSYTRLYHPWKRRQKPRSCRHKSYPRFARLHAREEKRKGGIKEKKKKETRYAFARRRSNRGKAKRANCKSIKSISRITNKNKRKRKKKRTIVIDRKSKGRKNRGSRGSSFEENRVRASSNANDFRPTNEGFYRSVIQATISRMNYARRRVSLPSEFMDGEQSRVVLGSR